MIEFSPSNPAVAFPLIVLSAVALDAAFGDPKAIYGRVSHPVVLLGRLIDHLDQAWNDRQASDSARRTRGMLASFLVIASAALPSWLFILIVRDISFGWVLEAAAISTLLAWRGLRDGVMAVAHGLDEGLNPGREAVSHIVGRTPDTLDHNGVARAAIESGAENLSDGVIAPLFWCLLLGLPGLAAYKAVNTLDSMIGHRTERFEAFGGFAARLDDAMNWLPARLTGLLICAAAVVLPMASGKDAFEAMRRDAGTHRSPNAGWPEAATAGALGLALGGPRIYQGETVEEPFMGHGRAEATASDIAASVVLTQTAYLLALAAILALWIW